MQRVHFLWHIYLPFFAVPFESLKTQKTFGPKDTYKEQMKLHSMRHGGIVGTQDGSYGLITYGSYTDKDLNLYVLRSHFLAVNL